MANKSKNSNCYYCNSELNKNKKDTNFKCDPLAPRAMMALQEHRNLNPNGMKCYNGRTNRSLYVDLGYVIYETKTTIVVQSVEVI